MSLLNFTIIQSNLVWENVDANLQQFTTKIKNLPSIPNHIVVLPEMFSTGFSMLPSSFAETMNGKTVQWMKEISSTYKIILTGSLMIEEEGLFYNRLLWVLPNGQMGYYNKRHLFAYAKENEYYTAGRQQFIAQVNGFKIKCLVCYDLRFPVWASQQSQEKKEEELFDVLIYVANWPERRSHAWKSLLVARAIENQCFVIACNRVGVDGNNINHSGDSMIINPLGEVLHTASNEEATLTETITKDSVQKIRSQFPFWKDGDDFILSL